MSPCPPLVRSRECPQNKRERGINPARLEFSSSEEHGTIVVWSIALSEFDKVTVSVRRQWAKDCVSIEFVNGENASTRQCVERTGVPGFTAPLEQI